MSPSHFLLILMTCLAILQTGSGLMCHRCYSAMGGCLHHLNLWMYPWKSCGSSDFCVKYIEKVGSDYKIIRECESILMKQTRHRLQMPTLRRHGYCLPARKHDRFHPSQTTDKSITYCFCNEYNGCNASQRLRVASWSVLLVLLSLLARMV